MEKHKFDIIVNKSGVNVLIVDEEFSLISEEYEAPAYEDFDAVLYKGTHGRNVELQFMLLNPITNHHFRYKPFFFHPDVSRVLMQNIADGYYLSADDQGLTDEVFRIHERMMRINFELTGKDIEGLEYTPRHIMIGIFRFFLTRNEIIPTPIHRFGSSFGYSISFFDIFLKNRLISESDVLESLDMVLNKYRYIESIDLIDKVHLCPECNKSHLAFTEICPKCESIDIGYENTIHHFPCANISPESTYMKQGELVCPKCSRTLRHIGVDYDRPAGIFSCHQCRISFAEPAMRAKCMACGTVNQPIKLNEFVVSRNRFTAFGTKGLSKLSIFRLENTDSIMPQLLSYSDFTSYVRRRIAIYELLRNQENRIFVTRVMGKINLENIEAIVKDSYRNNPTVAMAFYNGVLYSASVGLSDQELEERVLELEPYFRDKLGVANAKCDFIAYDDEISEEEFISSI